MTIYTSEKVMPYVYMGTHKVTGEFYIGSRANKKQTLPSHLDIYNYRTSSKKVKPIFDEFDWVIIAEFFDPKSAYEVEQQLIHNNWGNPLIMNRSCFFDRPMWSNIGGSLKHRAAIISVNKNRVRRIHTNGKKLSPEAIQKMISAHVATWVVTAPNGDTYTITNLAEHCRVNKLDPSTMRRVALGRFSQHKGWKCSYA